MINEVIIEAIENVLGRPAYAQALTERKTLVRDGRNWIQRWWNPKPATYTTTLVPVGFREPIDWHREGRVIVFDQIGYSARDRVVSVRITNEAGKHVSDCKIWPSIAFPSGKGTALVTPTIEFKGN